ncbi:hypothetical protein RYX36_032945 [Vicia faba]
MNLAAWPGRHLLEDGEKRRYFGLKTESRGLVEFECRNQREYELWTQGVSRLLSIVHKLRHNQTKSNNISFRNSFSCKHYHYQWQCRSENPNGDIVYSQK